MAEYMRFPSRRSTVHSTGGIVSSTQPLACEAGCKILAAGGNAADAAVAVAAALNVCEPGSTGVGGDMFCLFYDAEARHVRGLNGSGRSPRALSLDKLRAEGLNGKHIPPSNINAVTVPGAAAGWVDTLKHFGSGNVTMKEVLAPAIALAHDGFPVSKLSSRQWQEAETLLKQASPNGAEMLVRGPAGECHAPTEGEILSNPTLAETFRTIAEEGADGFYKGRIAEAIVELIKARGGHMTMQDLADHTSTLVEPISFEFDGKTVWECPPNGQGLVALLALQLIQMLRGQGSDVYQLAHNSTAYLHILIEALRIAFADGQYHITDPLYTKVPHHDLLHPKYAKKRAELFRPHEHNADIAHGSPDQTSDTVYFAVTDKAGNSCSFIISNYEGFGTGAIPRGCGFTLQNRGSNFHLEEGHVNCVAGHKRPYHTIIPAMVTDERGDLWASYGVMGGFMQPQGHVQVLLNMLVFGMDPQEALDAPRFCIQHAHDSNSPVNFEDGISLDVVDDLRKMGHVINVVKGFSRTSFGRGQIIRSIRDPQTGRTRLFAGSDPRGDGAAFPVTY